MKKYLILVLIVLIAAASMLSGCTQTSGTDKSWEKVKNKGFLVMGLDSGFPPMGFTDEKGEIVGFDVDAAREVCKRLGVELKLQPIDWTAKIQELDTGNIDCIWNGFTINPERIEQVLFTEPYMKNRQVIVVNTSSNFKNLSDLEGKKLGLQAGSSAADALDASADFKNKLAEVVEFEDNLMVLLDLESGRIDAALMDEVVARYQITTGKRSMTILDEALAPEEYGIGFRKQDKELMKKVEDTLKEMAKDGTLAEISKKWFEKDITTIR
ncbi:MAG TPA: amino acid ABC transporter substrate-binding protein [Clostridiaceae bacterium]|jgi:polar amino acid transport system substrate-binding protein|nr:amino acid ABC transporter substrate-binding protein [Clostridiaceae bacterium]